MAKLNLKNRRRNYFIKKGFQTEFILKFCMLVVLTALISAFVIYRFSSESVSTVFEDSRITIKSGTEFIMPALILSTLASIIIVGIATAIVVLFISHRIAGPLYKFESSLERMASGDVSFNIHFRRGDEIKKLAETFNKTAKRLNDLLDDVKKESANLTAAIKEIRMAARDLPEGSEDLKATVEELESANANLEKKLNKFKLR